MVIYYIRIVFNQFLCTQHSTINVSLPVSNVAFFNFKYKRDHINTIQKKLKTNCGWQEIFLISNLFDFCILFIFASFQFYQHFLSFFVTLLFFFLNCQLFIYNLFNVDFCFLCSLTHLKTKNNNKTIKDIHVGYIFFHTTIKVKKIDIFLFL